MSGGLQGDQEVRYSPQITTEGCLLLGLWRVVEFSSSGDGMGRPCSVLVCWRWRCCTLPVYTCSLLPIKCLLELDKNNERLQLPSWCEDPVLNQSWRGEKSVLCWTPMSLFQGVKLMLTEVPAYRTPWLTEVPRCSSATRLGWLWDYFKAARSRNGPSRYHLILNRWWQCFRFGKDGCRRAKKFQ